MTVGPSEAGLSSLEASRRLAQFGPNEIPEEPPHVLRDLAGRFWGPVPWMLEVVLLFEIVLDRVPDAVIIVSLLVFNALLAEFQEHRAHASLELLRHRLSVTTRVLRDGTWTTRPARDIVPGDRIHLKIGDIVPSDGRVVEGQAEVDQSTITGESEPVSVVARSAVYSGSVVRRGEATVVVTATGRSSMYGKTAELVRSAKTMGHLQQLLLEVVRYLASLDGVLALVIVLVAIWRGVPLLTTLPFALILLIASVPVAMPATFTIANAIEARRLVEQGVLVTGLTAVQEAASMDVLCVDKTGTLTEGRETVGGLAPRTPWSEQDLLALASATCDASSGDTVDLAVLAEAQRRGAVGPPRSKLVAFDPALKRSEATVTLQGKDQRVVLGAPAVVAGLCGGTAGPVTEAVSSLSSGGARVLAVAVGVAEPLSLVGFIALSDPPRSDAAALIRSLGEMGIRVVMLTGDHAMTAKVVAAKVGLGDRIGDRSALSADPASFDGFAGVYPEDKFALVQALQSRHHVVGMTGDGVNDAPALKQAEVGIAVMSATDVARASAKLVLTRPGLSDIVEAVRGGRQVYRRMLTWTLNKVSKNFEQVLLITGGFVVAGVFVTSPFLILMLVFANDFVTMAVGSDNARVSSTPDRWSLREIAATAAFVGGAWLAVSYGLLWWALKVEHLPSYLGGPLNTFFFVYLVLGSQATVLLVRERGRLWSSRPSLSLILAIVADVAVVSALAVTGTLMAPISPELILLLLGVVVVTALAVDQLKVAFIRWSGAFGPHSKLAPRTGAG